MVTHRLNELLSFQATFYCILTGLVFSYFENRQSDELAELTFSQRDLLTLTTLTYVCINYGDQRVYFI